MIIAALNLTIERGPGDTVRLVQGDNETLLSREAWNRIVAAVEALPRVACRDRAAHGTQLPRQPAAIRKERAGMTHSCDRELRAVPSAWAMSGYRQDGEEWTCSCGTTYVHVCDEAEGYYWTPPADIPALNDGKVPHA